MIKPKRMETIGYSVRNRGQADPTNPEENQPKGWLTCPTGVYRRCGVKGLHPTVFT
jgi:hypothetical protein